MKTKSKLVLGLSILSAATLAAGATSTFAWYQASKNTIAATNSQAVNVINNSPAAANLTSLVTYHKNNNTTPYTAEQVAAWTNENKPGLLLATLEEGKFVNKLDFGGASPVISASEGITAVQIDIDIDDVSSLDNNVWNFKVVVDYTGTGVVSYYFVENASTTDTTYAGAIATSVQTMAAGTGEEASKKVFTSSSTAGSEYHATIIVFVEGAAVTSYTAGSLTITYSVL